jgi:hypothetical protein
VALDVAAARAVGRLLVSSMVGLFGQTDQDLGLKAKDEL